MSQSLCSISKAFICCWRRWEGQEISKSSVTISVNIHCCLFLLSQTATRKPCKPQKERNKVLLLATMARSHVQFAGLFLPSEFTCSTQIMVTGSEI